MSHVAFSYEDLESTIEFFAEQVPDILLRSKETADLALEIRKLDLLGALEQRFTVAVVGQMRVGKSTLLNALIGKDLAPTGVTETTATINWFRYGTGDLCNIFRVHWINGDIEDFQLRDINKWLGKKVNPRHTRCIDFFADVEFLKIANLVDTPGIRSVIEDHERATRSFLAEKLEEDTLAHGGRADAVIYVINPVGRESDRDLLQLFGDRTRLPGAAAYNSIAAVQKWEHLLPNPLNEVRIKSHRLREQLEGKVAEVIPTSGLLARLCTTIPMDIWDLLANISSGLEEEELNDLLLSPEDFIDDTNKCNLSICERKSLLDHFEWVVLPFCVRTAHTGEIHDGVTLRCTIEDANGLKELGDVLRKRFFSRARLIKAGCVLAKAWEPCSKALLRLQQSEERINANLREGHSVRNLAEGLAINEDVKTTISSYLESIQERLKEEIAIVSRVSYELDNLKHDTETSFKMLEMEQNGLELLENVVPNDISDEETEGLRKLFGASGLEAWKRLSMKPDSNPRTLISAGEVKLDQWNAEKIRSLGSRSVIAGYAVRILESLLDCLEESE